MSQKNPDHGLDLSPENQHDSQLLKKQTQTSKGSILCLQFKTPNEGGFLNFCKIYTQIPSKTCKTQERPMSFHMLWSDFMWPMMCEEGDYCIMPEG